VIDRFSTIPLREAHAHLPLLGQSLSMLHLATCASRNECLERIRERASHLDGEDPGRHRWLLADGMRVSAWPDPRHPTREELDAICPHRPAALLTFDLHAAVANSAALIASGISDADRDPVGGLMQRDAQGRLTGLLLEAACNRLRQSIPPLTPAEQESAVLAALDHLSSLGFSEVHDLLSPRWLGPLLARLAKEGRLRHCVWLYVPLQDFDGAVREAASWQVDGHVLLAGAKVFADGTLNSRTAHVLAPFLDPIPGYPNGTALMSRAEVDAAIARTRSAGVGLAVHAIGDAAVRTVLDAFERILPRSLARSSRGYVRTEREDGVPLLRVEHAEILDSADVPRFASLGVVCSVQPCHLLTDIEVLRRQLPHRLDRVLPLRDLIRAGCEPGRLLWFGSDVPVVRADPQDSIQAAVHRRRGDMPPSQAIAPEQAIGEGEAWAAFHAA
jgi:predicted amidohydrolase YtcJ